MFALSILFIPTTSKVACPQLGSLWNDVSELNIEKDGWYYFSVPLLPNSDTLSFKIYSEANVDLFYEKGLQCPDSNSEKILSAAPKALAKTDFSVSSEANVAIFGLHATEAAHLFVSVIGENPNNHDNATFITYSIIYLVLSIVLLVAVFVHSVFARGKVHYQVELGD